MRQSRFKARKSYTVSGGTSAKPPPTFKLDKDPFYRTNSILNKVFRKNIRLQQGPNNSTDLDTIWVNFDEARIFPVVAYLEPGQVKGTSIFQLGCGHEWVGKTYVKADGETEAPCPKCSAAQSYLGFEHEWQHIIFKSDLVARKLFCERYAKVVSKRVPSLPEGQVMTFLSLLVNAFDDIRCNSLWEKVYSGSASAIWERWTRLTKEKTDLDTNFINFVFAVALNVPTDPNGPWEGLRDIVAWGTHHSRYRGFGNMLCVVRSVFDQCLDTLFAEEPEKEEEEQKPEDGGQPEQQEPNSEDTDERDEEEEGSAQSPPGGDPSAPAAARDDAAAGGQAEGDQVDDGPPSGSSSSPVEKAQQLVSEAKPLDPQEEHYTPSGKEIGMVSQATQAAVAKAMGDVTPDAIENLPDQVDPDVDQALAQLQQNTEPQSKDSTLTSDAKAKVQLIDVNPRDITEETELEDEELVAVSRIRAAIARSMGRMKASRSSSGMAIDTSALVQFLTTHHDDEVYESEDNNRGFAYAVLSDMSGSMGGTFGYVCRAQELLKRALKFPFVTGSMWGFRGGERVGGSKYSNSAEVWMYRYHRDCEGYIGRAKMKDNWRTQVPVECGGLTPLHPALNVVTNHLRRNVASGMAKRLFLLTDGSPCTHKLDGAGLPDHVLRHYVAKEIRAARRSGIQVYTLIIGEDSISDKDCNEMFGTEQYWKKVENNQVHVALSKLVLSNFTRYLRSR